MAVAPFDRLRSSGPAPARLWIPAFAGMTIPAGQFKQLPEVLLGCGTIGDELKNVWGVSNWCVPEVRVPCSPAAT